MKVTGEMARYCWTLTKDKTVHNSYILYVLLIPRTRRPEVLLHRYILLQSRTVYYT